ncbi:MAG: EamA family transporter [Candidatus Nomurabacteria bacterium]|nr:EamA family transporter [Candidatus Nomurabacteria bacterium]
MWLPFAILAAIISGSRRVYDKHLTKSFGNFSVGFIVQAFSLLPTLILFLFFPIPKDILHLPWQFWWPLLIIWLILYPVQTYFMYRSMREGELSSVTPILALIPAFNIISSFFLIHEIPSILGILGIILIIAGVYLLLKKRGEHMKSKPELWMIITTIGIAIGSTLDKISVSASTPVFYSFMNTLGASIVFIILMRIYKQHGELKKMKGNLFWQFMLVGIFQAISYTASMFAFAKGPTSYVLAIRGGGYIIAALWGLIVLRENFSNRKRFAFLFFLLGVILLAFS